MATTEISPTVINLKDRGYCAIDYIDYFDEGLKGPDKPYFMGRFRTFADLRAQLLKFWQEAAIVDASIAHLNRLDVPGKWMEPLIGPDVKYPRRAQYALRVLLRIKFFNDFAYVDIGRKWTEDLITAAEEGNLGAQMKFTAVDDDPQKIEIVNSCWISGDDAVEILKILTGESTNNPDLAPATEQTQLIATINTEVAALAALNDDEGALTDDEGDSLTD